MEHLGIPYARGIIVHAPDYREGSNRGLVTPDKPQRPWQAGTVRDPLEVRSPRGGVRVGARARSGWGD